MDNSIAQSTIDFFLDAVESGGYEWIFLALIPEGSFIPLPLEEIVIPFAGYLTLEGKFSLWMIAFFGGFGTTLGACISYGIGKYIGISFFERYGKYFFISKKDIKKGQKVFQKYGKWAVLFSRIIPGVRGFIPIIAGISKMNLIQFTYLTFIGSYIYIFILAYIGSKLGERWEEVKDSAVYLDYIAVVIILAILFMFLLHIKRYYEEN